MESLMKTSHIVKIKKTNILTGITQILFVMIDETSHYSESLDSMIYSGSVLYPDGNYTKFADVNIIKDFGIISFDDLINEYPEHLI